MYATNTVKHDVFTEKVGTDIHSMFWGPKFEFFVGERWQLSGKHRNSSTTQASCDDAESYLHLLTSEFFIEARRKMRIRMSSYDMSTGYH